MIRAHDELKVAARKAIRERRGRRVEVDREVGFSWLSFRGQEGGQLKRRLIEREPGEGEPRAAEGELDQDLLVQKQPMPGL